MKQSLNEFKRMQQLAGLITESHINEAEGQEVVNFLNQHKQEIFNKFDVEDIYGVSEEEFLNGNFEISGPFIFHDVEGNNDSSIEFTLLPNKDRNNDTFKQDKVKIDDKEFYLTTVK